MTRKQPAIPQGMVGSSSATFARLAIWMAVLFLGKQACQYPLNLHPMDGQMSAGKSVPPGGIERSNHGCA